jgi:hypothetical protein
MESMTYGHQGHTICVEVARWRSLRFSGVEAWKVPIDRGRKEVAEDASASSARVLPASQLRCYGFFASGFGAGFFAPGLAAFFLASPSLPPISVKESAALNGN